MENTTYEKVNAILSENNYNPHGLIPILQAVQEEYRYLPENVMAYVASSLGIPASKVFGVASFYSHFTLQPKGKYIIKICDGTACHVKRSTEILNALEKHLGLAAGQRTTEDLLFTIEMVACLGTCGLAPAIVINDKVHGLLTPEKAVELVKQIQAKEANSSDSEE
ncbi:MAG: NADH-quinone oxidoreductase subunit NuoE [Peptococcaceae bacterium]|nr:NADH-quinone oxidoreductase subunit NuoE [Peptococcaceae bacterium]